MTTNVTAMAMSQVDVEAHQKQGFGLTPRVFDSDYLTIPESYVYHCNHPQLIEISVF